MTTASVILEAMMLVVCVGSGLMDLRAPQQLRDMMERLKVPVARLRLLAAIKFLAAAGLAAGFFAQGFRTTAAVGLVLYFAVATTTHLRVKDGARHTLPAFVLLVASLLLVLTTLAM